MAKYKLIVYPDFALTSKGSEDNFETKEELINYLDEMAYTLNDNEVKKVVEKGGEYRQSGRKDMPVEFKVIIEGKVDKVAVNQQKVLEQLKEDIKKEISKIEKDPEYQNDDAENNIFAQLEETFGYDWQKGNNEDERYFSKSDNLDRLQYLLDKVLPRFETKKEKIILNKDIELIRKLAKKEIDKHKKSEKEDKPGKQYGDTERADDNQNKIFELLEEKLGYNWEYDEDAADYFLKSTGQEILEYVIDTILPKLEKENKKASIDDSAEMSEAETKMYIQNMSEEDWNRLKPENKIKYKKYRKENKEENEEGNTNTKGESIKKYSKILVGKELLLYEPFVSNKFSSLGEIEKVTFSADNELVLETEDEMKFFIKSNRIEKFISGEKVADDESAMPGKAYLKQVESSKNTRKHKDIAKAKDKLNNSDFLIRKYKLKK